MKRRGLAGIPGIGPALQSELLYWSRAVEAEAMRTRPVVLLATTEVAIKDKYAAARMSLSAKRDDLQQRMAAEQARISAVHQAERDSLAAQERQAQTKIAGELTVIHQQYLPRYKTNDEETIKARGTTLPAC